MIWHYFVKHHAWPTFAEIDRQLYAATALEFEDVVEQLCPALLRGLDPSISHTPQGTQQLSLTLAGAANCSGTGAAINAYLAMLRTAAQIEPHWRPKEPGENPMLLHSDLEGGSGIDPKLTKEATFAAAVLGAHEPAFGGGGSDASKLTWSLYYDRGIRKFAEIRRLEEYWQARTQVMGPERTEADNRPYSTRRPEAIVVPTTAPVLPAPAPVQQGPAGLEVTCALHPLIADVAAERFTSGFYYDAVRSAFQAVEHRVQTLVGSNEVGPKLMGIALGNAPGPKITVTRFTGASLESEQNGMQFLFKGAMAALRNPRMHGPDEQDGRDEAEEMLVIASFLMRRLDIEDESRNTAAAT